MKNTLAATYRHESGARKWRYNKRATGFCWNNREAKPRNSGQCYLSKLCSAAV